jgi:Ca2+/Na+ antiporter
LIRGVAISLAYIVRGGLNKKVHADDLVTEGFFNHGRNPLYVGNILMLVGVGILMNSMIFMLVFIPLFLFIYQAIVLAEENFLRSKFGAQFDAYCARVNRWWINFNGIGKTINSMAFNGKRWLIKEYNTQTVWMLGIAVILLYYYPQLTHNDKALRDKIGITVLVLLAIYYVAIRYLKKSGKWKA